MQILDDLVPQMGEGEQVVEFMRKLDAPALDKISLDRVSKRCPRRLPRRVVERLVEVPTIIPYSSFQQRTSEQIIDIPVLQGRGGRSGHGGLQGVSQGQGSTVLCGAYLVDILVPRSGGLQGFPPKMAGADDESEAETEVEEGAAPRTPDGPASVGVCLWR